RAAPLPHFWTRIHVLEPAQGASASKSGEGRRDGEALSAQGRRNPPPRRAAGFLCRWRSADGVVDVVVADRGREAGPVELAVTDQVLDRDEAAGVVADRVLGGHADATVQLDGVEADVAAGDTHLQRRVRGRGGQLLGRGGLVGGDDRGPRDRAAGQLERDVHVRGAVVERLERVE